MKVGISRPDDLTAKNDYENSKLDTHTNNRKRPQENPNSHVPQASQKKKKRKEEKRKDEREKTQ